MAGCSRVLATWYRLCRRWAVFYLLASSLPLWLAAPAARAQGDAQFQAHVERLRSGEFEIRRDAVLQLGASGSADAVPHLIERLQQDSSAVIRATAATALGLLGTNPAESALIAALGDKEMFVRKSAAYALGNFSGAGVTGALITALRDKEPEVRSAAVQSLGRVGDAAAVPALLASLGDKDSFVRAQAVSALGQLKSAQAVAPLIAQMQREPEAEIRRRAVVALGQIAGPQALAAVRAALNDEDLYVRRLARQVLNPPE